MLTFGVNKDKYVNLESFAEQREKFKKLDNVNIDVIQGNQLVREWAGEMYLKGVQLYDHVTAGAYAKGCQNNEMDSAKKFLPLLSQEEFEDMDLLGVKGVAYNYIKVEDEGIESVANLSDCNYLVNEFLDMRDYLICECDIDLWYVVEKCIQGNHRAMAKLRTLSEEFYMVDLIKKVFRNDCLRKLQEVMA